MSQWFTSSVNMWHKLEPNIVLDSVDRAVTSPATPIREADKKHNMLDAIKY